MKKVTFFVGLFVSFIAIIKADYYSSKEQEGSHEDAGPHDNSQCNTTGGGDNPCDALTGFILDGGCEELLGDQIMCPPSGATEEQEIQIQSAYAAICAAIKCLKSAGGSGLTETLNGLLGGVLGGVLGGGTSGSLGGILDGLLGGESSGNECEVLPSVPPCSLPVGDLTGGTPLPTEGDASKAINLLCNAQKCLEKNGVDQAILPDFGTCVCPIPSNPLGDVLGLISTVLCILLKCVLDIIPGVPGVPGVPGIGGLP